LYDERYQDEVFRMHCTLDAQLRMRVHFEGRGSSGGTRAFIRMLTEMHAQVPAGSRSDALLDCTDYAGTPIRAQLSIGKWLLRNTAKTGRIALAGAQPLEEKVGRAVMKIARIDRMAFFPTVPEGQSWLGWT